METNDEPSKSHLKSDSLDEDDQHHENISTEQLVYIKLKTFRNLCFKNQNQVKNSVKIDWLDMSQIEEILKKYNPGKKKILPRIQQKWNPLDNISDLHSIVSDVVYKFDFVKYAEIKPYWWASYKHLEKDSGSETSNSYQNSNDCSQTIVDTISETTEIDSWKRTLGP